MTLERSVPLSVLDLAPVVEGGTPAASFPQTLELAQHAERLGYNRYWLAEHHNMAGIASSATSVVIGYVAGGTKRIRVGSGGIMLPNHAPLVIAEQFGTLESMYPGRIDLGLGRAPGSDQTTARALRRDLATHGQEFPELLSELRAYFNPPADEYRPVRATPGEGLNVPIWLLGSSGFSAKLAGELGLPFSFASHFAPEYLMPAIHLYRSSFRPSEALDKPYIMVGVNIVAADTDEEAKRLATSQQQQFLSLIRGRPGKLRPPVDNMDDLWQPHEREALESKFNFGITGSKAAVESRLQEILRDTMADELIVTSQIYDHEARMRSFALIAEAGSLQASV
ncbi:LLM class flavin-dependent oxidoreductase [Paenibacillus sacheonensis]|uniref:MsnO8 family LLM class oxidoreductase n=1 Tax=Paenibacillus sacheonensis TaxID=742054 RepID=A0A7X4YT72_9BACL|nr:LLM class flavin-dependent oxidoreductase [Paenibacillus sacheonensis]MBM7568427.1 luciferase family oxidoreductase group 1 [Paenibacillus sacheonensis]NBC72125.1 MsnO8 family LLM class oxidoreductase [Paenibacillus sacheonensis]